MFASPYYWWVQSVMPVVFDNSLSYYEVLAKLTQYVEGLISDVDKIEKIIGTIEGIEDITQFMQFLQGIQNEIGNLSNLNTQNKNDLVSAINDVVQDVNNKIGNLNNLPTRNKSNLVGALSEIYDKAQAGYVLPSGGIPESDLSTEVQNKLNSGGGGGGTVNVDYKINNITLKKSPNNNTLAELGIGTYSVPEGGIPESVLSEEVRAKLNSGGGSGGTYDYTALINKPQINNHTLNSGNNSASELGLGTYSKPSDGIPESDLSNGLAGKINRAYVLPITGIPESDLSDVVKEKLNTSGGIADENNGYIARRNYDAGELVYINGVLYKVTQNTLAGSNFVAGNNIVETDINGELADINDKIDEMASGQGLDSWALFVNLRGSGGVEQKFFEYIRCTGGEDYLFIVNRSKYEAPFVLKIYARNGTLIDTQTADGSSYNDYRFTFTPENTGDYYCALLMSPSSNDNIYVTVTVEYTQSQGITELWNKVNEATELEPRVEAVEGLVEQQQTELDGLNGIVNRVDGLEIDIDAQEDEIDVINKDIDNLEECAMNSLIPYACNGENTNILTLSQDGNDVTINGTTNATPGQTYTRVSLSGKLYSWNSNTTPAAVKIYPVKLIAGHTYKLKISLKSGSLSHDEGTGIIYGRIYNENETKLAEVELDEETDTAVTFVSDGDKIRVVLYIARLMTLTDAIIRVELSDKSIEDIPDVYNTVSQLSGEMAGKQDVLTFDDVPTKNSVNPVKSGGIYNSIKTQIENSTGVQIVEYTPGYMVALGAVGSVVDLENPTANNASAYAVANVIGGQNIKCKLTNGSVNYRAYAFINENNEIIRKATVNNSAGVVTFVAPPNATKIILNAFQATTHEHWAIIYPIGSDKPWNGLYVSLLGDSISALQYYIPSGNKSYYGPNKGTEYQRSITEPEQMWWYKVITELGGTPLIIDAWSGSSVAVDGGDAGTIAMCELSRCNNLHAWVQTTSEDPDAVEVTAENIATMRTSPFLPSYTPAIGDYAKRINPDIVLSTGGTNDWTYAETAGAIGTYDGHTGLANPYGEEPDVSTFREAYATMLCRIQKEYPFALIICSTGFFNCRPYTQKYNCNTNIDSGLTMLDYANAIREIAALRACPVVSVWENGFSRYNYYDTFAGDSEHQPTHPNIVGHDIIAKNALNAYAETCKGYTEWMRNN